MREYSLFNEDEDEYNLAIDELGFWDCLDLVKAFLIIAICKLFVSKKK